MSIDKETARRAAHLARIAVAEEDLEHLAAELSNILPDAREGFFAVPKVVE
jgi:aspartyl-tRNA(Asn)/glutamyl-tRNA(Gln) amidotransferase subunit C